MSPSQLLITVCQKHPRTIVSAEVTPYIKGDHTFLVHAHIPFSQGECDSFVCVEYEF